MNTVMADLYRSPRHESVIRRWCTDRLQAWPVPHTTTMVSTQLGPTHLTSLGHGDDVCVYLPGTNFNAATSTALLEDLARACLVVCADLPGQPGLSADTRPRDETAAYSRWLGEVLLVVRSTNPTGRLVVMGHSRGAAVALLADPGAVDALILLSPAGLASVHLDIRTLVRSVAWLMRPTDRRSARLVALMTGSGELPDPGATVAWMTLVARNARTTGAPGPLAPEVLARWQDRSVRVVVGENDVFFPPQRLAERAPRWLGRHLDVVPGAGHLLADERPDTVTAALASALA